MAQAIKEPALILHGNLLQINSGNKYNSTYKSYNFTYISFSSIYRFIFINKGLHVQATLHSIIHLVGDFKRFKKGCCCVWTSAPVFQVFKPASLRLFAVRVQSGSPGREEYFNKISQPGLHHRMPFYFGSFCNIPENEEVRMKELWQRRMSGVRKDWLHFQVLQSRECRPLNLPRRESVRQW